MRTGFERWLEPNQVRKLVSDLNAFLRWAVGPCLSMDRLIVSSAQGCSHFCAPVMPFAIPIHTALISPITPLPASQGGTSTEFLNYSHDVVGWKKGTAEAERTGCEYITQNTNITVINSDSVQKGEAAVGFKRNLPWKQPRQEEFYQSTLFKRKKERTEKEKTDRSAGVGWVWLMSWCWLSLTRQHGLKFSVVTSCSAVLRMKPTVELNKTTNANTCRRKDVAQSATQFFFFFPSCVLNCFYFYMRVMVISSDTELRCRSVLFFCFLSNSCILENFISKCTSTDVPLVDIIVFCFVFLLYNQCHIHFPRLSFADVWRTAVLTATALMDQRGSLYIK